ncbi:MAG: EAL domain-containing protein [Acidithiobacillus sp.]|nr:EAL domain-containing protein [Acidithiobacillus sp.]
MLTESMGQANPWFQLVEQDARSLADVGEKMLTEIPQLLEVLHGLLQTHAEQLPLLARQMDSLLAVYEPWLRSLFLPKASPDFCATQENLGYLHAQLGIPAWLFAQLFSQVRRELTHLVLTLRNDPVPALLAIQRILDLSQHLSNRAYVRQTEHSVVKSLRKLAQHLTPETFFRESARLACRLVHADGAALILRAGDRLRYAFFEGLPEGYRALGEFDFSAMEGAAGAALQTAEPVYLPHYPTSSLAIPAFVEAGLQASLAIPLMGTEDGLGVLAVSWFTSPAQERIPEDQWDYLRLLGDMLAGVLYRSQLESKLESLATRDLLTELPNRRALPDRITSAIARADRHHNLLAVLFLDLDGFKPINDRLGHARGDATLKMVAGDLRRALRMGDSLLRYAGDEFIVLLEEIASMEEIEAVADRLLATVRRVVEGDGLALPLSASIGISVYPFDDSPPESLVHHADLAMYRAKGAGGDTWQIFDGEEGGADQRRLLLGDLHRALELEQFCLFWQPIVDLRTGAIRGAEALLRWQHPVRGLLPPGEFLALLEKSPLIHPLGQWILHSALQQTARWHEQGKNWDVHINLAAAQLEDKGFVQQLAVTLEHFPTLERDKVWLEIVERVALEDVRASARMIQACRNLGVHFTLDDFGTGAAALQYLAELECSGLKIDRGLVLPMKTSTKHHTMVRTLVEMARSLSVTVVAEGVEDAETVAHLAALGVSYAQGYYFSPPVPVEQLSDQRHWK